MGKVTTPNWQKQCGDFSLGQFFSVLDSQRSVGSCLKNHNRPWVGGEKVISIEREQKNGKI
jgi:hypothetical protein